MSTADDRGMTTAEHAVGTIGACTIAIVTYRLACDGTWFEALVQQVRHALQWRIIVDGIPPIGIRR